MSDAPKVKVGFINTSTSKPTNEVQAIRLDLRASLRENGIPTSLYLSISDKPPVGTEYIQGDASMSKKDGKVMFNFGGKSSIGTLAGRLQGNFFVAGMAVDQATLTSYQKAHAAAEAARNAAKK